MSCSLSIEAWWAHRVYRAPCELLTPAELLKGRSTLMRSVFRMIRLVSLWRLFVGLKTDAWEIRWEALSVPRQNNKGLSQRPWGWQKGTLAKGLKCWTWNKEPKSMMTFWDLAEATGNTEMLLAQCRSKMQALAWRWWAQHHYFHNVRFISQVDMVLPVLPDRYNHCR